MIRFFADHLGTVLVELIVAAGIVSIIVKIIFDKRKGKCIGCDCKSCDKAGDCRVEG